MYNEAANPRLSDRLNVCLINDSFPPQIDGVANAVVNYATVLSRFGKATVLAPSYPGADDSSFPFEVLRYPSVALTKTPDYRMGLPFSGDLMEKIVQKDFDVIHSHCPMASTLLARAVRTKIDRPVILTYHTKFDIEIGRAISGPLLRSEAVKAMIANISACDEVWCVSDGAGKNLKSMGYKGAYRVMPNGVDLPRGKSPKKKTDALRARLGIPKETPVFLYVGRMMWYKGLRIILDGADMLFKASRDFFVVFVGGGEEKEEIADYAQTLSCTERLLFIDPTSDREKLRAFYSMANVFLFPSEFDTNGLVVREAAACALPSVLIKGSCAADGVFDGKNGFLIEADASSMCRCLTRLCGDQAILKSVGEEASKTLCRSWEDAVKDAYTAYKEVVSNYDRGLYPPKKPFLPEVVYDLVSKISDSDVRFLLKQ